jgi:hypothetical protein
MINKLLQFLRLKKKAHPLFEISCLNCYGRFGNLINPDIYTKIPFDFECKKCFSKSFTCKCVFNIKCDCCGEFKTIDGAFDIVDEKTRQLKHVLCADCAKKGVKFND